ncbi:unnamed protein product [Cyclocybe aegerita]|uniref:Uncharacterized protein n=1 Tax=Cyclocybe aegerita TaxID=1973307 RepID=A0A8S0XJ56_CYCAE|nr:unnamed protein product [Cyclocybe aegerita]
MPRIVFRERRPYRSSRIRSEQPRQRESFGPTVEIFTHGFGSTFRVWCTRKTLRAIFARAKSGASLTVDHSDDRYALELEIERRYIHCYETIFFELLQGRGTLKAVNPMDLHNAIWQQAFHDAQYRYLVLSCDVLESLPHILRRQLVNYETPRSDLSNPPKPQDASQPTTRRKKTKKTKKTSVPRGIPIILDDVRTKLAKPTPVDLMIAITTVPIPISLSPQILTTTSSYTPVQPHTDTTTTTTMLEMRRVEMLDLESSEEESDESDSESSNEEWARRKARKKKDQRQARRRKDSDESNEDSEDEKRKKEKARRRRRKQESDSDDECRRRKKKKTNKKTKKRMDTDDSDESSSEDERSRKKASRKKRK